jgi:hypothetical protein
MTEAAAFTLPVERVSVWFLNDAKNKIVCADLFERNKSLHSSGVELSADDFAPYFEALRHERTIAADAAAPAVSGRDCQRGMAVSRKPNAKNGKKP